jgi:hypothetical protein
MVMLAPADAPSRETRPVPCISRPSHKASGGTRFRHDNLLERCIRATIFGKIDRLQFSLLRVRLVNRKIHWRRMLGYSIRLM